MSATAGADGDSAPDRDPTAHHHREDRPRAGDHLVHARDDFDTCTDLDGFHGGRALIKRKTGARRGMTTVCVLGFLGVLALAGTTGMVQRSAGRRAQEWSHAHRLLEAATDSALEEACARIEARLPDVPAAGGARDLAAFVGWPIRTEPARTRRELAADGVRVGTVSATSSPWMFQSVAEPGRGRWIREVGVIELETRIEMRGPVAPLVRRVVARRYAWTAVSPSGVLRVRIESRNLMLEMKDS